MADAKRRDFRLTPTSSKDLKALARTGPEHTDEADTDWRANAPSNFRSILQAVEEKP